jgi:hypothetical protein
VNFIHVEPFTDFSKNCLLQAGDPMDGKLSEALNAGGNDTSRPVRTTVDEHTPASTRKAVIGRSFSAGRVNNNEISNG